MTIEKSAGGQSADVEKAEVKDEIAAFDISIYDAWCKECALCVDFCPRAVLTRTELGSIHIAVPEKCRGCMQCVLHCPDFAISVTPKEDDSETGEG